MRPSSRWPASGKVSLQGDCLLIMQLSKSLRNIADVHNGAAQKLKRILCVAGQALAALFTRLGHSAQRERLDLAGVYRVRARNCRELSARVHNGAAASALLAL